MKKLFIIVISFFVFCFYSFASTAPYDYSETVTGNSLNIDRVYIIGSKGADVKEKPNENSKTLVHIPQGTQVRVVAIRGPKSNNRSKYYADYYLNWTAIFIPDNLRTDWNQIGWINNPDDLWWDPYPNFGTRGVNQWSTSDWSEDDLNGYLLNHVWEMTFYNKNYEASKKAIVTFEENQGKGLFFSSMQSDPEEKIIIDFQNYYSGIEINVTKETDFFHKGIKTIRSISETSFEIHDTNDVYYVFKAINPGTILEKRFTQKFNTKHHQTLVNYIIKESCKYFRIYARDWYNYYDVSDYLCSKFNDYSYDYFSDTDTMQNPYNLKTLAIAYGVWLRRSENSGHDSFIDYWVTYIKKYENEFLSKDIYTYRGIGKPYNHLYKEVTYKPDSNLYLRKSENRKSEPVTIMTANTKVTIIDFGQPEVIDGILSTWVKVRVLENTVDRDKKPLPAGTEGWCFGGYLEEIK